MIDARAIIADSAQLADDVTVGPYTVIGDNVTIDTGTWIGPNVVIPCNTKIGKNNKIYQFASIGGDNQDLVYDDKPTYLEIGDNNVFHEFVTINRGSVKENCITKIGDHNLVMAYSHIGHDCIVHDNTIFANGATLAGHVEVDSHATIGAYCAIHQFCNIGTFSFVAHGAMVTKDILSYVMASGNKPKACGLNKVGLERNGFSKDDIKNIMRAYKIIFRQDLNLEEAKEKLKADFPSNPHIQILINNIQRAKRGIVR